MLGAIYALVALGYTLVYGVLLMINFAHSEIFMLGAFAGVGAIEWIAGGTGAGPLLLAFAASMIVCGAVGVGMERIAYRPLRRADRLAPLISAIGVSILLQNLVFLAEDENLGVRQILAPVVYTFHGVTVSRLQILIIGVAVLLMACLHLFIRKSRLGKAIQCVSQDREASALMGIPVNRTIALTFLIGGALGGAAGWLNGLYYGSIKYNMGFLPGLKAFTAAVLGGIGNIPGAMLGGFLLGILEALGAAFLPEAAWKDVFAFGILILVLLVRPTGILGERVAERT